MASKTQIGAVIGIGGEKEYQNQLKLLIQYTKEWKSETEKLTSTFEQNNKSMEDANNERKALEKEVESLNKVLKLQQERYGDLATTMNTMPTDAQQKKLSELRTTINQTETKINDLNTRIRELPDDNFFSKKEYTQNVDNLNNKTKLFTAQIKELTTGFKNNSASVQENNKHRELLQSEINTLNDKLKLQKERYEALSKAMNGTPTEEQKKEFNELGIEIHETSAEINSLTNEMNNLPADNFLGKISLIKQGIENNNSQLKQWGELLTDVGKSLTTYVTLPIVGAGTAATKTAGDFQSAFTGVKKTVDEIVDENGNLVYSYADLEEELRQIPLETASTYETVMAVAQAAGQLGIQADDVADFTKNMIMLGDSTNITAEDAAVSIAQFLNIMGESTDTASKFGSALVALGNNTATDEASILALATRMAAAGKSIGLSTADTLGLSAAMSSLGLTAEAGGTAMSTTMQKISMDVAKGGENVEKFAQITGMSADEFVEKWRNDPITVLQDLLTGMGNLEGGGEELIVLLDELGWSGIRQSDTVKRLALDYDGVASAVDLANTAYGENSALTDEANKRYEDFNTQVTQLKESFKLFLDTIGQSLMPMIQPIIETLTTFFNNLSTWWSGLGEGTQRFIIILAGLIAAIGPVLMIAGQVLTFVASIQVALAVLGTSLGTVAAAALPVIGVIAAIIAAIIAVVEAIKHWDEIKEFITALLDAIKAVVVYFGEKAWEFLKNLASTIWEGIKTLGENILWGIVSWLEGIIAKFVTFLTTDVPNFVEGVKNFWENLKTTLITIATNIFTSIKNIFSNIFSNIKSTIQNIKSTIKDVLGSAFSWITGKVSEAWNWGKDLIGNLVDGIKSKFSAVKDACSSLAGKISSYLHFSEPDIGPLSDFHTWMPDMMKGLAKGIDDNAYLVDNAISRVADSLALNQGSVNYGGVTINLNVPQGANGQQIVNEIETELANRTMRRKVVFG